MLNAPCIDMSGAKHADCLFVKVKDNGENDLVTYCTREGIKHITFNDFSQALKVVESVVKGEKSVDEVLAVGKA
jgi:2-hydroxy-3-keto-5-methylthiopentenyl-1-phosphate phosphatase